jgi:hypothetical protein
MSREESGLLVSGAILEDGKPHLAAQCRDFAPVASRKKRRYLSAFVKYPGVSFPRATRCWW